MAALLDLAGRYPDAVIPGYTHMRRAQAVLWPHYLLAYFEMFARDWERLGEARRRTNVLPLGSGALAGSGFPFDRDAIARDLGFDAITPTAWTSRATAISPSTSSMPRQRRDDPSQPPRRRLDSLFERGVRLARTRRRRHQRLAA